MSDAMIGQEAAAIATSWLDALSTPDPMIQPNQPIDMRIQGTRLILCLPI
ncbi:MAG: hypothetical protein KDE53_39715 [Caldilineaceae bacterium]|nr:hypothetical protein [Caldilineaceae bacterium]